MAQVIQLYRTTTLNAPPTPLAAGEMAVCIAAAQTKAWIGDGTNNRLIFSTDANDTPIGTAAYLPLAGGTMSGVLTLIPPVNQTDAATKDYVDTSIANLHNFQGTWQVAANNPDISGGSGPGDYYIAITANPNNPETAPPTIPGIGGDTINNGDIIIWNDGSGVWQQIVGGPLTKTEADSYYVTLTGDTMTGPLILSADPGVNLGAATKQYVDNLVATAAPEAPNDGQAYVRQSLAWVVANFLTQALGDARYLQLAGGTLTGALILAADPTVALGAATMQYVDNAVGGVITTVATDASLTGDGLAATPLSLNVQTDGSLTGAGSPGSVLSVNVVDGGTF